MTKRKAESTTSGGVEPHKRTRRMKVLSTSTRSEQQQAIYEANAVNSPLLRLPPEIRNRIWYFALGGRTIHICSFNLKGRHHRVYSVCQVPGIDDEFAKQIVRHNQLSGEAEIFEERDKRHGACHISRAMATTEYASQSSLNVLRTCRQVHVEGALIPFKLNDFDFFDFGDVARFLQSLFQEQAHAIEAITLSCVSPRTTATLGKLVMTRLKGLRQLRCFVDVSGWGTAFRTDWSNALSRFYGLATISATVLPYNGSFWMSLDSYHGCSREVMRAWAKEMEDGLIAAGS
ncbi:hypothetical protein LTR91_012572 [Friedmanniomyces endolithicus]|uniref:DUF7730 domain-containing protein n=1 Tax=Friedmanniomyces endolithicus TaxID=329885 RepID=A0AAN6KF10_9PEZI|nr:hypothetical protein LTR94_007750 [Friedmanniomyces endolithicus]KAK0793479.1 hypothetical protein LTR38_009565 [Friedmanniomyces endolithicus]KAK0801930.1 hypothetical protein LTR59_005284 [Friedmanniomyces endolithicus]KAK0817372.1 hypothetical protein LTR75_003111 [Friedmanniomyces endolithicus]KAK0847460.1 hypothetical protein LTR03_006245 [Friedmanniomyces endolithicus]